ncbi:MAG: hypothetical protein K2J46_10705 [Muribaculaceae bacterium]|nr:hypothetical protein [Muribaculaceae bacterium]
MNEKNIHKIIDLYFEAQLSRPEEEELFSLLLAFKGDDDRVKEALAVMIMSRNPAMLADHRELSTLKHPLKSRFFGLRNLKRVVAVALVVLTCATPLLYRHYHNSGVEIEGMMAYVGGVKVSDHSEIMKIVDDQLNDISNSSELFSQTIASDLDDIRNAFNEEGI